jgi:hypothetical protein
MGLEVVLVTGGVRSKNPLIIPDEAIQRGLIILRAGLWISLRRVVESFLHLTEAGFSASPVFLIWPQGRACRPPFRGGERV